MSGFRRTEKLIFAIAAMAFFVTSYLLYDDSFLFARNTNNPLNLLGSVKTSQNDVRRKNYDAFSWMPAATSDRVFENDSIFTGDRSEAELQLSSGAKISLSSNSLVTLNMKNSQMNLDLRYGNIKGEIPAGQSLHFTSGNEEYVIENPTGSPEKAELEITQDQSGNIGVKLVSGNASFLNKKTQSKAELSKNKTLKISKSGDLQEVIKPELLLKSSENVIVNRENPNDPVHFDWQSRGEIAEVTWELSPTQDFEKISSSQKTSEQKLEVTDPLDNGTYYWRLKAFDKNGQLITQSTIQMITINNVPKPPVSEAPPLAVLPKPVQPPVEKVPPEKPVLITKTIDFKVPPAKERSLASSPAPLIKWKGVNKVRNYQVQIARNERFTEATKFEVSQNETSWSQYRPGKYHYRIVARGINGLASEPSDSGTMNITVEGITLEPLKPVTKIGKTPLPVEVPFNWTEIPFAKKYLVQMDKDAKFSQPMELEYPTAGGKLTLREPGLQSVRVQALDEDNQPLTPFSNVQEAQYTFYTPLDTPLLTEPLNNASIFLQTEMEPFIWLEWKSMEKAISYSVEISDKDDFSRLLISKTINKNRFLIKDRVPLGKIYWRVRANSKNAVENSPWSEKREFMLHHQKNEIFVK